MSDDVAFIEGVVVAALRRMAEMTPAQFAKKLGVTTRELLDIEAGRIPVPARFDRDAYDVVDDAIEEMGY